MIGSTMLSVNAQENPDNPLLKKWTGPYGGVPAFNEYNISQIKPAFDVVIKERLSEIEAIANNPKAPTFENTIAQMERAGKDFKRVMTVYGIYSSNLNSPEFEPIEREMGPILASLSSKIYQNKKLFKRIETLYNSPDKGKLTREQERLIWLNYTNFVKEGANLNPEAKEKVAEINGELASYFSTFS